MTILASIRRNRRSAPLLSAAVFAWFTVLVTPCAMAYFPGTSSSETVVVVHADCSSVEPTKSMTDSDCCCNLTAMVSSDVPQLANLVTLMAPPIVFDLLFNPTLSNQVSVDLQTPLLHETSPPIYLATQRLRI